jgi:hypothetical protein
VCQTTDRQIVDAVSLNAARIARGSTARDEAPSGALPGAELVEQALETTFGR